MHAWLLDRKINPTSRLAPPAQDDKIVIAQVASINGTAGRFI